MKKNKSVPGIFILSIIITSLAFACNAPSNTNSTGVCGASVNLCFELNGSTVAVQAVWFQVNPNRHRIYWEESAGADYKNIEIDLYNTISARTYMVTSSNTPADGEATFQYYLNVAGNQANYQGQSGQIVITSFDGTNINGTFTLIAEEQVSAVTDTITNGHIDGVPAQ